MNRLGVSQCVTSSRYALRKIDIKWEKTGSLPVDTVIEETILGINRILKMYPEIPLDQVAMALPQAFMYDLQLSFNFRSLLHFLDLRLAGAAHETIRKVAVQMLEELPKDYRELALYDKKIYDKFYGKWNDHLRMKDWRE